jgi:hypothetical protein
VKQVKMSYTVFWNQHAFTEFTYNNVINLIPKVINAKMKLENWGFVIGNTKEDSFAIERNLLDITFIKTNRNPYTKDLMKVLILMAEYGAASDLGHDDLNMMAFIEALNEIHTVHPLVSYNKQKIYFVMKHLSDTN